MIVYRFENNGIGPYANHWGGGALCKRKKGTRSEEVYSRYLREITRMNAPFGSSRASVLDVKIQDYVFGCPSKKALRAYFGTSFKFLFSRGFRIKRYNVPDDEILHLGVEVAFPIKYHKFQTGKAMRKKLRDIRYGWV